MNINFKNPSEFEKTSNGGFKFCSDRNWTTHLTYSFNKNQRQTQQCSKLIRKCKKLGWLICIKRNGETEGIMN